MQGGIYAGMQSGQYTQILNDILAIIENNRDLKDATLQNNFDYSAH